MEGVINTYSNKFDRNIATLLLLILCVQFVAIEGFEVSSIKVVVMAISSIIFITRAFIVTSALFWCFANWVICYLLGVFHEGFRFSTVGYFGLFLMSYVTYYGLLVKGAMSIQYFKKILAFLIRAYAIILFLQQICMLLGIYNFPIINLYNQDMLAIDKLPSLSLEPSHSARILAVAMLCYLRCEELLNNGKRPNIRKLFQRENRWVTIPFLYAMLTMGSGTAFIAIGCLILYFVNKRNVFVIIPMIIIMYFIGDALELKQFERAKVSTQSTFLGDNEDIADADGSASARIIPLMNTLKMDLSNKDNWFGYGTISKDIEKYNLNYKEHKITVIDQYGLIGFILSLLLLVTCIIRRFFCLEMLFFVILFGMTLSNVAYVWGAMYMFTAVRYFQVKYQNRNS